MQIVIDIPEEDYSKLLNGEGSMNLFLTLCAVVLNGTPLPKGHGRLIDADILANDDTICDGISCFECPFKDFRKHSCRLGDFIKNYHAIIEADKDCKMCRHFEETDESNCYECVKGLQDNFEADKGEEE